MTPSGIKRGLSRGLTADLEGCLQLQKNGLAQENLPGFKTQTTDFVLCQLYILSRPGALHWGRSGVSGPGSLRQEEGGCHGCPTGTPGGAWTPGLLLAGGSCCWFRPGTPTTLKALEGTAVRKVCHPKPHSAGPLPRGARLLRFCSHPEPGQPVRPWPSRGGCSPCPSIPRPPPRLAATWGGGSGRGTSRPVPAQSKLAWEGQVRPRATSGPGRGLGHSGRPPPPP